MPKPPSKARLACAMAFAFLTRLICLTWLLVLAPSPGSAQSPADAPDVVVLADGGFVRGTLVEHAPGQYAVLLTLGGQLRRFEASELSYVGPAEGMPRPALGPPTSNAVDAPASNTQPPSRAQAADSMPRDTSVMVEVRFEAASPLEVLERNGISTSTYGISTGESYAPLCTAPCVTTVRPGMVTLGVAQPGGRPIRAGSLILRRGSIVRASYDSRLGVRVGGLFVALGGIGGGLAVMLSGMEDDGSINGRLWAGAILTGFGTLVGLLMTRVPDSAEVQIAR